MTRRPLEVNTPRKIRAAHSDSRYVGIYCSQSCRLLDLEKTSHPSHDNTHMPLEEQTYVRSNSTTSSPSSSPQFAPTRSSNLPSLPILNTLDRYIARTANAETPKAARMSQTKFGPAGKENTSIWRRRSILFYST